MFSVYIEFTVNDNLVGVDKLEIEHTVIKILNHLSLKDNYEIEILIVNDKSIKNINKERRGHDKETDVLSFPMECNEFFSPYKNLGEIVISIETLKKQAKMFEHSDRFEFYRLLIHGILHLLGYDHETNQEDEIRMQQKEDECLELVFGDTDI
ncbi:MAG: rRNA maturation RNase YbeY [Leptospiraceae bacterium]|nr:rRNA maturation RNase YbeY [Leptospiraceae bacterium]MCP5494036.1 rRNA maturation RNase YbeY [Leptospiraceae bacterium]